MSKENPDSFHCFTEFRLGRNKYYYYSLDLASQAGLGDIANLPISVKILLENHTADNISFEDLPVDDTMRNFFQNPNKYIN